MASFLQSGAFGGCLDFGDWKHFRQAAGTRNPLIQETCLPKLSFAQTDESDPVTPDIQGVREEFRRNGE
ncbi:MAG: hypothetical protein ABSD74_00280 [Rhizomicrobium sp.]